MDIISLKYQLNHMIHGDQMYEPIEEKDIQDNDILLLNAKIVINGQVIPFEVVDIQIILNKGMNSNVDYWNNHKLNPIKYSGFYPFTCSCGEPGCAGIWNGILVKVRKNTVEWRCSNDDGYNFLPKKFYSFKREKYENWIEGIRNFIVELEKKFNRTIYIDMCCDTLYSLDGHHAYNIEYNEEEL